MSEPATGITVMSYQGLHFRDEMAEELSLKDANASSPCYCFIVCGKSSESDPRKEGAWSFVGGCSAHGVKGNLAPYTTALERRLPQSPNNIHNYLIMKTEPLGYVPTFPFFQNVV